MKKSFVIYESWSTLLANIPTEQAGMLIQAICKKQLGQEVEISDPTVAGMFAMIAPTLDEDSRKYSEKCKRMESARKSAQKNGKSEQKNDSSEQKNEITEQKDEKSGSESDSESDSDSVSDSVHPTDVKESKSRKAATQRRHKYGKYGHVMLTDDQHDSLVKGHGEQRTEKAIQKVDDYCEETGKRYSNYYLTICRWGYEEPRGKPKKATDFNNFPQRDYDMDSLEKQLLRSQQRGVS